MEKTCATALAPPGSAIPRTSLLWLTTAVLAAHLWLLLQAGIYPTRASAPQSVAFITRAVPPLPAPVPTRDAASTAAPVKVLPRRPGRVASPVSPPSPRPAQAVAPEPVLIDDSTAPAAPEAPVASSQATTEPTATTANRDDSGTAPLPSATASAPAPAPAIVPATEVASAPTAPGPAPAVRVPPARKLYYTLYGELKSLPYRARGELLWQHDGSSYQARLEVSMLFLGGRVQTSAGSITAQGLAPKRFGDKVRSEVAAHFERDKGKIIFSANTPDVPLQDDAQDQLSIFMQIASLIAGEPTRYPAGSVIALQAVGARDAEIWSFTVHDEELLHLTGGEQQALKLTRPARTPNDPSAELWLAPTLGYLPVRIRLTQSNGDFIDQQWRASETP